MKVTATEWSALMEMFLTATDNKMRKALFEMWLEEKMAPVYQQGWKDACEEYDIKEDYYDEEEDFDDPSNVYYEGY